MPVGLAALLAIAILALTSSPSSRSQVLSRIQQPAISVAPASVSHRLHTVVSVRGYRLSLGLAPNRASVKDWVSVALGRHGVPLTGARVTVTYSMPSMKMWRVLTSRLEPTRPGAYVASQPVLGMAGRWQLSLEVAPKHSPAFHVTINDGMGA